MSAIHACSPASDVFLNLHELEPLVSIYKFDKDAICLEAQLTNQMLC